MPRRTSFDRVLPKGDAGMPRPTSFDRVCCPNAMMSCHTYVVRPCLLSKGYDSMPRPTSFDRVCYPKAMKACHARRCLIVCDFKR